MSVIDSTKPRYGFGLRVLVAKAMATIVAKNSRKGNNEDEGERKWHTKIGEDEINRRNLV